MKKLIFSVSTIIVFLGFNGCSRTHQPNYTKFIYPDKVYYNIGVGYEDFEISKDTYKVTYNGYVTNNLSDVMQYAHKRAKILCKEKGFNAQEYKNSTNQSDMLYGGAKRFIYSVDVHCINN